MTKTTGRTLFCSDSEFDWSLYENGYTGGHTLIVNKSVKTKGKDKVYCHESYAQEIYDLMGSHFSGHEIGPKDQLRDTIHEVSDIRVASDHEVIVDSPNGSSARIDLNKEIAYIHSLGYSSVKDFVNDVRTRKEQIMNEVGNTMAVKVIAKNRVSLWEGKLAKIKAEFAEELQNGPRYAYYGTITAINNGGYTCKVNGVDCFLPGSLASSGPITDFDSLIGKTLHVCVVNYSHLTNNYVVSHKKFLELELPGRVEKELEVGQRVSVKVTGCSKNGVFCAIEDKNGEFVFPSLMHRTTMSRDAEIEFENRRYIIGDQFFAYIHRITWSDNGQFRIVIGDKEPVAEQTENEETQNA
jgi:hypothetical protein